MNNQMKDLVISTPSNKKVFLIFDGTSSSPSWKSQGPHGTQYTIKSLPEGDWALKAPHTYYPVLSSDAGEDSHPPTTGWATGYSVGIVHLSPSSTPVNPINPTTLGFAALFASSKSHNVTFSLKDGATITAHRFILEPQAPTLYSLASEATGLDDLILTTSLLSKR